MANKASTKTAPKPGQPSVRGAGRGNVEVEFIRSGVLGVDPKVEAPSVPAPTGTVNAKAFDVSPHERGSAR